VKHAEMVKMMGRMVLVRKVLERQKDYKSEGDRVVSAWWEEKELEKERTGWVVGYRHLQVGYVQPGTRAHDTLDGWDYGDPAEWRTEKTVPCVLVAFWPTEKPVHVPMDGYTLLAKGRRYLDRECIRKSKQGALKTAPEPYPNAGGWHEHPEWRKEMSEIMKNEIKDRPRDKKGRWVKKT